MLSVESKLSPGFVANVGSFALAALVGAELLALGGSPCGPAVGPSLFAAGVAMWAANFASPGSPSRPSTRAIARPP